MGDAKISEKRRPVVKIVAVFPGKRTRRVRLELFSADDFKSAEKDEYRRMRRGNYLPGCGRFRVRANGRWIGGKEVQEWTLTQFCDTFRADVYAQLMGKRRSKNVK